METEAADDQRSKETSVCMSGEELRSSPSDKGTRRPYRNQETFLSETWREEVEVREMFQEICSSIRLESSFKDLWD